MSRTAWAACTRTSLNAWCVLPICCPSVHSHNSSTTLAVLDISRIPKCSNHALAHSMRACVRTSKESLRKAPCTDVYDGLTTSGLGAPFRVGGVGRVVWMHNVQDTAKRDESSTRYSRN